MKDIRNNDKQEQFIISLFHKNWLKRIKQELGKRCTFISHVTRKRDGKDEYLLSVYLNNETGGKDKITYKLGIHPDRLSGKDYEALLTMIKKGEYEQGSTDVLSNTEG